MLTTEASVERNTGVTEMSDDIKIPKEPAKILNGIMLSEDAHARVVILWEMPETKDRKMALVAISVKWLLVHGVPLDPDTGLQMKYHGTHIIQ